MPVWLPFPRRAGVSRAAVFLTARRGEPGRTQADRRPQEIDRQLYGYPEEPDDEDEDEEAEEEYAEDDELEWEPEAPRPSWPLRGPPRRRGRDRCAGRARLGRGFRSGWRGLDSDTRAAAEERFSDEAARIVGRPVEIRCDESGERVGFVQHTDGVAEVGGRLAYLTPERCHALYRLAFDDATSGGTGRAIAVLAHEAWHLRGVRDESTTSCYGFQSGVELGERLGLSEDEAAGSCAVSWPRTQARARASSTGSGPNAAQAVASST